MRSLYYCEMTVTALQVPNQIGFSAWGLVDFNHFPHLSHSSGRVCVCVCVCITKTERDFPGGPVVQTPGFHYRRLRFDPWSGKFHIPLGEARKQTPHCAYTKLHAQSLNCVQLFATPCSSVYGISQARILKWVAIPSSRGSFQPRDQTLVSCIAGRFFLPSELPGKPTINLLVISEMTTQVQFGTFGGFCDQLSLIINSLCRPRSTVKHFSLFPTPCPHSIPQSPIPPSTLRLGSA